MFCVIDQSCSKHCYPSYTLPCQHKIKCNSMPLPSLKKALNSSLSGTIFHCCALNEAIIEIKCVKNCHGTDLTHLKIRGKVQALCRTT